MIGSRLWQVAGWTMLHYFWVGGALGVAALLLRQRLRSAAAGARYLVALGSLLLLSIAPAAVAVVVTQEFAPTALSLPPPVDPPGQGEAMPLEQTRPTMPAADSSAPAAAAVPAPEADGSERLLAALDLAATCLPWLWVFGAPLSFALTTAGLLGAERLRRQSRPLEDARISEMCRRLALSLRISCRVGVAVCDRIAAPILVGVFRPLILLPAAALAGWDPQQLEMVLLHELAHVRRCDNLVNLLQRLVESLLFFQPMVWIISGWVRQEREHCCDELVVARTRQPQAYAEILVALVERFPRSALGSPSFAHRPAVSSMAERSLVARIRRILKKEEQAMQVSRKAVGLVLVGFLVFAITIGSYYSLPSHAEESSATPTNEKAPAIAAPAATAARFPPELQKPVVGKNFIVLPFTSELQRAIRRSHGAASLFVLINAAPMINKDDTVLDVRAVDFKSLRDALRASPPGRVSLEVNMGPRPLKFGDGNASRALVCLLHNDVETSGSSTEFHYNTTDWKSVVAKLSTPATMEANRRELGVGDDLVKVYRICTPLSRYFAADNADCVIRNLKPLDRLTPEELQTFPARAKSFAAKLGLKPPVKALFVLDLGKSMVRANRAQRQLHFWHLGDREWWKARGFASAQGGLWNDHWRSPLLWLEVTDDNGSPVKDVKITADFPPEIKDLGEQVKFVRQKDGRWCSRDLPYDDEFTLTVEAPGHQPFSKKFKLPEGAVKELEVKLKPAIPKVNNPAGKTSAQKPKDDIVRSPWTVVKFFVNGQETPANPLTYTGRVTDKQTGKRVAGVTVTVCRRESSPTRPFQTWPTLGATKHQTDAAGRYAFTIPQNEAADKSLYLDVTVDHPDYVHGRNAYYFDKLRRKNEKRGGRPFLESIYLWPAEKISGTIVTPQGKPAAGVMVRAFTAPSKHDLNDASWPEMTTDNEGHFQFNVYTGGEAIFWILPKDYAPSTHVAHTKRGDFGRFVLEKGLVLKGHVVDIDGKPLPNVWVNAEIRGGPAKQSLGMSVFDKLARAALSDRNGEFRMAPLPAGVYDLIEADYPRGGLGGDNAVHPLPAVFLNRQITLDQKEAAKSIEVRAVPHVVMGGQFFDSSGKPASGVELRLWGSTKGPEYWDTCWFGQAQIDERGKLTARFPRE
jgi:beta-lactamase regulating signal transducer with metallopeptidase domain/5-hydroxyisourate hydrolase-like protein (transthyretin family)